MADEMALDLERAYEHVLTKVSLLSRYSNRTFVPNDLAKELDIVYNEIVSMYPEYEDEFSEIIPNKYNDDVISVDKYVKLISAIAMLVFIKSFLERMFAQFENDKDFDKYKDNPVLGYKLIDRLMKNVKHVIYIIVAWSNSLIKHGKLESGAFKVSRATILWFKKIITDFLTYYTRYDTLWDMHNRGIEEYSFYTSEDERVCSECGALHEKTFKVDNAIVGTNFPPIHNHCRCWIMEVN